MGYLKHLRPCTLDCDCKAAPCDACLPTVASVECRYRSATKSKCGYPEYPGYASTPPKYYLERTLSGTLTYTQHTGAGCTGDCVESTIVDFSGVCSYDSSTCVLSIMGSVRQRVYANSGGSNCSTLDSDTTTATCELAVSGVPVGGAESFSATTRTITGAGCVGPANSQSGAATETLSSEYTTILLSTTTGNALLAASWSSYGSCSGTGGYYVISSDHMTLSQVQVGYRINFSGPVPAGTKLTWHVQNSIYGVIYSDCVNLSAGATSYTFDLSAPAWCPECPDFSGYIYANSFALAAGSC